MKHMKVREGEAQNPRQFRSLRTGREFEDRCHGETQLDERSCQITGADRRRVINAFFASVTIVEVVARGCPEGGCSEEVTSSS
jgi:hypothetical protein